jgi:hypothetical protein
VNKTGHLEVKIQKFCKMFWAMLNLSLSVDSGRKERIDDPEAG